jgi:hypothetical protein
VQAQAQAMGIQVPPLTNQDTSQIMQVEEEEGEDEIEGSQHENE